MSIEEIEAKIAARADNDAEQNEGFDAIDEMIATTTIGGQLISQMEWVPMLASWCAFMMRGHGYREFDALQRFTELCEATWERKRVTGAERPSDEELNAFAQWFSRLIKAEGERRRIPPRYAAEIMIQWIVALAEGNTLELTQSEVAKLIKFHYEARQQRPTAGSRAGN